MEQKHVVLVEDDSLSADAIIKSLKILNVAVTRLEEGTHAAEIIAQEKPDAVILDIMVVGKTGLQIIGELKESHPEILKRVVVMTNMENADILPQVLETGVTYFIKKSDSSPDQIAQTVKEIIGA